MAKHGDPLTPTEQHIWGSDARRHDVIPDLILEQGLGAHDSNTQALMYVENLARTDPELAAMWRRKLAIAKK
jgi:hypothetical protein